MGIALIILLPISVVFAATMRSTPGPTIWFQIHRALGVSPASSTQLVKAIHGAFPPKFGQQYIAGCRAFSKSLPLKCSV